MRKLYNHDIRMTSGLVQRADVRMVINDVIDRLNESYKVLSELDAIPEDCKELEKYNQSFYTLDTIFAFLASCGIFTSSTYREYLEELKSIELDNLKNE